MTINTHSRGGVGVVITGSVQAPISTSISSLGSQLAKAMPKSLLEGQSLRALIAQTDVFSLPALFRFQATDATSASSSDANKAALEKLLRLGNQFRNHWLSLIETNKPAVQKLLGLLEKRTLLKYQINQPSDQEGKIKEILLNLDKNNQKIKEWFESHPKIKKIVDQTYPHGKVQAPKTSSFAPESFLEAFVLLKAAAQTFDWNDKTKSKISELRRALRAQYENETPVLIGEVNETIRFELSQDPELCYKIREISFSFRKKYAEIAKSEEGKEALSELDGLIKHRKQLIETQLDKPDLSLAEKVDLLLDNGKKINTWLLKNESFFEALSTMYDKTQEDPYLKKFGYVTMYLLATDQATQKLCQEVAAKRKAKG